MGMLPSVSVSIHQLLHSLATKGRDGLRLARVENCWTTLASKLLLVVGVQRGCQTMWAAPFIGFGQRMRVFKFDSIGSSFSCTIRPLAGIPRGGRRCPGPRRPKPASGWRRSKTLCCFTNDTPACWYWERTKRDSQQQNQDGQHCTCRIHFSQSQDRGLFSAFGVPSSWRTLRMFYLCNALSTNLFFRKKSSIELGQSYLKLLY